MKTKETKQDRIRAFKALDLNFKCRDFQFGVGKEYHEENIKICEKGFHSCTNPFDILNYYNLTECRFAEVEVWGKTETHKDDSKIASTDIFIKKELSLSEFISVVHDYMYNECKNTDTVSSGYGSKLASSGDESQLASSGDRSQLASSGDRSKLASSGYGSKLASSGYGSQLASSGYGSQLASSGYRSQLASSGYRSKLASSGYRSKLELNGIDSVGANIGYYGQIKGIKGTWITLAEYENDKCVCVKSAVIDGEKLKENTWYKLENKKFTEVK